MRKNPQNVEVTVLQSPQEPGVTRLLASFSKSAESECRRFMFLTFLTASSVTSHHHHHEHELIRLRTPLNQNFCEV